MATSVPCSSLVGVALGAVFCCCGDLRQGSIAFAFRDAVLHASVVTKVWVTTSLAILLPQSTLKVYILILITLKFSRLC